MDGSAGGYMMATATTSKKLAVDGGLAVRQHPFQGWPIWDEQEEQALLRTLRSGQWGIGGEETEAFEQEFAQSVGVRFSLSVTNGTAALEAALRAVGVGYGDEVIVPPYTFLATATAVILVGAIPVFADIDPESYCLSPAATEAAITSRTKAIVPVHLAGNPADMEALCDVAKRHGLKVVEDACQAVGARWSGRGVGGIGDMGCFSFQASKNINSGEGGSITTDDPELYDRAWSFKNCGRVPNGLWYQHDVIGDNFRMTQFQAALLRTQLTHLEEWSDRRSANAEYLRQGLSEIGGLIPQRIYAQTTRHGYHSILVRYQPEAFGNWQRERFLAALNAEGIPASRGYIPLYDTGAVRDSTEQLRRVLGLGEGQRPDCPVNERACNEEAIWLLGQSPLLGTRADMDDVLEAVAKIRAAV